MCLCVSVFDPSCHVNGCDLGGKKHYCVSAEKAYASVPNYSTVSRIEARLEDKVICFNRQSEGADKGLHLGQLC